MRLSKTAANRPGIDYYLADENLLERNSNKWGDPSWNDRLDELKMGVRSRRYHGSQYDYTIAFSNKEIIHFIKLALEKAASNRHEKALGMGAVAIIEELLKSKESETEE